MKLFRIVTAILILLQPATMRDSGPEYLQTVEHSNTRSTR